MSDQPIFQLRDEANELLARGKYKKAYQRFKELRQADPTNPDWATRVGELAVSFGEVDEAIEAYRAAAMGYAHQGQVLKAIAACKYVLDLDPSHTDTQSLLAELFARDAGVPRTPGIDEPAPTRATPPRRPSGSMPIVEARALREELPARPVVVEEGAVSGDEVAIELDEDLIIEEADASFDELHSAPSEPRKAPPPPPRPAVPALAELPTRTRSQVIRLDVLPRVPLFSSLPREALESLIGRLTVEKRKPGEVVVREGEPGHSLYVVVTGLVEVTRGGAANVLARLGDGTFFGELALVTADPRTATVTVVEPTELLAINRAVMNELVAQYPQVLATILSFVRGRLVATLLATSPLFTAFDLDERRALAAEFELREMDSGAVPVKQGQRADALQLILAGQVAVERDGQEVTRLGAGELFGELSLLGGAGTATIRALRRTWTLALPRAHFQEVVLARPQILAYLSELADRRARANQAPAAGGGDRLSLV
jgi:CRP-like cAMP-binding protein